jgi:hypothetical protein
MASRIKLKRSLTPNSVPTTSDLSDKEVALNITDRSLFVNNNGTIVEVLNADPNDEKIVPSMFSSSITDGVGNTWYVSTNGTDKATLGSANPRYGETTGANQWGATPTTAFASLKYCLDNYAQSGDLVVIASGQYEEIFPLTVPDGVAIKGAGLKSTFIRPSLATNDKDAFLIEGNCNIEDLCVNDFYYNNVNDTGYAFRLASGYTVATDGRRPYIQRCSVITKGSTVSQADPRGYSSGDAGRGALVDGAIVNTSSAEAALLFNECTFVVPNSVGLYLKNGARCEWLNSFTYFAADSIKGENPGGSGFAGQGRTRLKLNTVNGTFNAGNTITYYDTDGTTVLASGTIDENDGTYIYIDGQGSGSFAEASDILQGKQVIVNGDAQLDTTNKQFGASSLLLDGTGDYLSLSSSPDFGFGTGDFTVEMWVRPSSVSGNRIIYDSRVSASSEVKPTLYLNSGILTYYVNGAVRITGATLSVNTWYHVLLSRSGTSTKLFVNGTQSGSTYTDTNDYGTTAPVLIGTNIFLTSNWSGHIDEVRVSKGVARYTANFTSTTTEYTPDVNTSLLLHFNGIDGSTDIFDGGISSQDVRSSSGGTAQYITLADYTDFGAELRSIGSASVYGQRGVSALGKGVRLRCIIHNFGYVGTGADQSNDISNVNQANEIIETGGGRVLFTSMDQNGDFRVGNAFFVDQEKGTVSFAGGAEGGNIFDSITVTSLGNTTTILPTSINVGNLEFSGDTIENLGTNGIEFGSKLELLDGSSQQPSLTFIADNEIGLFRDTDYVEYNVDTNGDEILSQPIGSPLGFSFNGSRKLQVGRILSSLSDLSFSSSTISGSTVVSFGTNYPGGQHSLPLIGGSGSGATANLSVLPFIGTITNAGSGYNPGTTQSESIVASTGNGSGGLVDVEIYGIDGGSISGGSGYTDYEYGSVPLQGGNGTDAQATLLVSGGQVVTVTIEVHGTGYLQGDILSVNNSDLQYVNPVTQQLQVSGGSGFSYTLTQLPGSVKSFTPNINPWDGFGYEINDVLTFTDTSGSGSGFSYTISQIGIPQEASIGLTGDGYNVGDRLTSTYFVDTSEPVQGTPWISNISGAFGYITYNVIVLPGVLDPGGNRYFIDIGDGNGYVEKPDLQLKRNYVYSFVFTDVGAQTHPFRFSTTADGTHGGGVEFTTDVRKHYDSNGSEDGVQIVVTDQTPNTLYYYCTVHADMAGTDNNEATVTVSGTFQSGLTIDVDSLSRNSTSIIRNDGSAVFGGIVQTPTIENTGQIITSSLLVQQSSGGIGGDAEVQGDLEVKGNATIVGDLIVQGTSEFSATVGGAGEVAIGDADADTVNIRGDVAFNPTYSTPVPPATTGVLQAAQIFLDQSEAKIGIFNHQPDYEVDVTGSVRITSQSWLATTSGSVGISRNPDSYNTVATLDVGGDVYIEEDITVNIGTESNPSIKFNTSTTTGLYGYLGSSGNSLGITTDSGTVAAFTKSEIEFYRNLEFINKFITDYTINGGSNYVIGDYTNIELTGGNGTGLIVDLTVAFSVNITNNGAGYTPAIYTSVPLTIISSAQPGAIQQLNVVNGGNDYVDGTYTNVSLNSGNGSLATADITILNGTIIDATINQVGSSYLVNDSLTVDTADIGGSKLDTVTIDNGGSGYTNGIYANVNLITSSGTGLDASALVTVSNGSVTSVSINEGGSEYTLTDTLTINGNDITTAQLDQLLITNAGTGYANGTYNDIPLVYNSVETAGDGISATVDITVTNNVIVGATVNQSGQDYLVGEELTVDFNDIGGNGAGIISSVTISNPGSGFSDGIFNGVSLTSGSGSNATATIGVGGGQVTSVEIEQGGLNYILGETLNIDGYSGATVDVQSLESPSGLLLTVDSIIVGSGVVLSPNTLITGSGASIQVTSISDGTGGSGATANVEVGILGDVQSVVVTNGGSGYSVGDVLKIASSDMLYDDGGGNLLPSTTPSTEMEFTIDSIGSVSIVTIIESGEGHKLNDVLSTNNTNLGGQGFGFSFVVDGTDQETTISIDEKLGSIDVKQLDAETFTIDDSLTLTATGVSKTTAGNLQFTALSPSAVQITGSDGFVIPVGNTASRPIGQLGMIRYNSEENQFEGFNGISFVTLGAVRDVDLDTFITAEKTTGADDDTFRFFNGGIQTISITDSLYRVSNITNFEYVDLTNVTEWVEGESVVSPYDGNDFDPTNDVDLNANTITVTAHNLTEGVQATYINNGGVSINPLVDGSAYYVHVVDENTVQLAETLGNLDSEIYVNLSATSTDAIHSLIPLNPEDILYYYGDNVYAIKSTGTFDADPANFPTHTTGTVTNGTVDLEYIRNIFSSPTFSANNFQFSGSSITFNDDAIKFIGDVTSSTSIISASPELEIKFNVATIDQKLLKITNGGSIQINTEYGSAETYKEVLTYELNKFTLKDTQVLSADATIDTSVGNSVNLILVEYDNINSILPAHSGKIMVEIVDDSVTTKRQYSEISFLISSDSSSAYYTEVSKLYTDEVLCDISVDVDGTGNVVVNVVDVTSSSTAIYTIKAVSNTILA